MPKYSVRVNYVGADTFIVEATNPEEAEEKARERYREGDSAEVPGWEEIDETTVEPFQDAE